MRLVRRSNGIYHFRLILPQVLKRALGKREVHHSLKTRKKRIATTRANKLYKSYMDMIKDDTLHDFLVELANGTKVTIKHDDPEEERKHLQAVLDRNTPGQRRRKLNDFLKSSLSELIDEYLTSTADEVTHRTQKERIRALGMYEGTKQIKSTRKVPTSSARCSGPRTYPLPPSINNWHCSGLQHLAGQQGPR